MRSPRGHRVGTLCGRAAGLTYGGRMPLVQLWSSRPAHSGGLRSPFLADLTSSRPSMTRIPTATRRQRVEVRASRKGLKLPTLPALARHGLLRFNAGRPTACRLGCRRTGVGGQPATDGRKRFVPARSDRLSTLVTHGGCAATRKDENARSMNTSPSIPPGYFRRRNRIRDGNLVLVAALVVVP